jgi:hypothetical protein
LYFTMFDIVHAEIEAFEISKRNSSVSRSRLDLT